MKKGIGLFVLYRSTLMLILRDDKPLISNPCRHSLVGGAVEEGEEFVNAAHREFGEETSLDVAITRLIPLGIEEAKSIKQYNEFFAIFLSKSEYQMIVLGEGQRYQFHAFDDISTLHTRGDVKYGLGGAISRFMHKHPHIVRDIIANTHFGKFQLHQ